MHRYVPMLICLFGLALTGCGNKNSQDKPVQPPPAAVAEDQPAPPGPARVEKAKEKAKEEPLDGVDLGGLSPEQRQVFFHVIDKVQAPCGKAQSLRTSLKTDPSCRRGVIAALRIVGAIKQGATEVDELATAYDARYGQPAVDFDYAGMPFVGAANAPVKVAEFFDYGCPHCKQHRGLAQDLVAAYPGKVAVYFMMYPLVVTWPSKTNFPYSIEAAQAALAANAQGKFPQMSEALWDRQGKLDQDTFLPLARSLGLDEARFTADFKAALPTIEKLQKVGNDAGVDGTPMFFVNGRKADKVELDTLKDMIDEELAVSR
jgi:protein-disulfide isomerase